MFLNRPLNQYNPSTIMASTYLLDGHQQCLSSHSLVQVPVRDEHRIQLLTWRGSYKDVSLGHGPDNQYLITWA